MDDPNKATAGSFLEALSWLLFGLAGLSFWVGGRAIREFAKSDRILAEMAGIGLAVIFGGAGALAKSFAEQIQEDVEQANPVYNSDPSRKS